MTRSLSSNTFSEENFGKITQYIPNKVHRHDMISIRMLQICGAAIRPIEITDKA